MKHTNPISPNTTEHRTPATPILLCSQQKARLIKRITLFTLLIANFSLLIVSCDWDTGTDTTIPHFDWDIHGTWTTNDPNSRYTGTLEITYNRITITGYSETQTPAPGGNDLERPFRNFTKGIALEGYTEEQEETGEKFLLIKDAGTWKEGIPYIYWYTNPPPNFQRVDFLRFNFGGRQETLRKQ